MELKKQNLLFFTRSMQLGGTENVVLQLCVLFKPLVNNIVVCSSSGVNVKELEKMGIRFYEIPDIENKSVKTMYLVSKKIEYIVKQEKITVIHTHHRMAAFYVSLLGLYRKCIFFNTSHNTFNNKKLLTKFAYKHANLIACGNAVKTNLEEYFGLKRVSVVRNSVKQFISRVEPDDMIKRLHEKQHFVVGNVGRISEQKGFKYYIKAASIVLKQHPSVSFLVIGSGEEESLIKDLAIKLGIQDNIVFLGYRNDVQNLMTQLDLVVLSSLWEGFPLTPIEAFSVGKTVVATAVDGTVEIVQNMENGLLVKARSSEEIASAINWMIEHPEEKKKMEENALNSYNNKFTMKVFSEGYISLYESAKG